MKAKITERALFARIDRKLAKDGERLRRCRSDSRAHAELGDYYIVAGDRNTIETTHVELERLARSLDLLADWEELEQ
jgi:hypothetical protein